MKNSKEIIEKYPEIYGVPPFDMSKTLMEFGFECPDAWEPVIVELSEKIQTYLDEHKDVKINVQQVKEKFGTLRFYYSRDSFKPDETISKYIAEAEDKVTEICCNCGYVGDVKFYGWNGYLCKECK